MIRNSRGGVTPRRLLIAAAAVLVPIVAGCEAGNNAPTLQWHQPTDGTLAYAGTGKTITIANAFVLGGQGGRVLRPGESAGMFFGLVNTGSADRLVAIRAPGVAQRVQLPGGGITLRRASRVLLTGPKPAVVLQNLVRPLNGGSVVRLYLVFQRAGTIRLSVPVMPMTSQYVTFSPATSTSPTATGTSTAHAKATGTAGSPSPSPTSSSP